MQEGGTVHTGRITLGTGHASLTASPAAAAEHYDNTGAVVADVVARDGTLGIWVAGALRPSVKPERIRELRGASLSGDWRRIGGALELVGLLAVNVPGFPVPRALSASGDDGKPLALVAAGITTKKKPDWEPADEFDISETTFAAQAEMLMARIVLTTEPWS